MLGDTPQMLPLQNSNEDCLQNWGFIYNCCIDKTNTHIFRWFQKSEQFLNAAKVLQEVQMEPLAYQYVGKKGIDQNIILWKIYEFS